MADIIIRKELIELGLDVPSKEEAIRALGANLHAFDYVTDDYVDQVLRREENFPTGLPTSIPVALCHTEAEYVKQSAMAVGTLVNPVEFKEMGTLDEFVQAEIIFLLALNDPKQQVPWLSKMATVFKEKETLLTIKNSQNKEALVSFLKTIFQ